MIKEIELYMKKVLLSMVVLFAGMFAWAGIPQKTNSLGHAPIGQEGV